MRFFLLDIEQTNGGNTKRIGFNYTIFGGLLFVFVYVVLLLIEHSIAVPLFIRSSR